MNWPVLFHAPLAAESGDPARRYQGNIHEAAPA
jgi:hypothetical protein